MPLTAEERERIEQLVAEARERYRQGQPSTTTVTRATSEPIDSLDTARIGDLVSVADVVARLQARVDQLRAQRRAEAAARGISCVDCWDTGRCPSGAVCSCAAGQRLAEQERAVAQREALAAWQRWEQSLDDALGIPARLRGWTLGQLGDSEPIRAVRRWLSERRPEEGLVLVGPFGCGKTVTAAVVLRELVFRDALGTLAEASDLGEHAPVAMRPPDARELGCFTTATGLLEALRPRQDGRPDPGALSRFRTVHYLVIDDLGAERLTPWGADRLYEVLNSRYNAQLPVIVTTNLDLARLAQRWNVQLGDESGDRLVNRLIDCCAVVRWPEDAPNLRLRRVG
jgi:DNA replication protein DnaC